MYDKISNDNFNDNSNSTPTPPTTVHMHLSPTGSLSLSYLSNSSSSPLVSPDRRVRVAAPARTDPARTDPARTGGGAALKVTSDITSDLNKASTDEENVSPQIGTPTGGFKKVSRLLLPFTPTASSLSLRKSQDFLDPTSQLKSCLESKELERLNTDEFMIIEAQVSSAHQTTTSSTTPLPPRSTTPLPPQNTQTPDIMKTPTPNAKKDGYNTDLSNYLTATGEKNYDSPNSLHSLSPSPPPPSTPLTPKIQPRDTGSSNTTKDSAERWVDNYWNLDSRENVDTREKTIREKTPYHERRVSWDDCKAKTESVSSGSEEGRSASPFSGYDTPKVRQRVMKIQNATVGGRGSGLTRSKSPVEQTKLAKPQEQGTTKRKEKTFGPMIGSGAPTLSLSAPNLTSSVSTTLTQQPPPHHFNPPPPPPLV